jgi:hypothetical protein
MNKLSQQDDISKSKKVFENVLIQNLAACIYLQNAAVLKFEYKEIILSTFHQFNIEITIISIIISIINKETQHNKHNKQRNTT